jgi:hypothetical protein
MSNTNNPNTTKKALAHSLSFEWIEDSAGDVCLRPMHFDAAGKREVRYRPDPVDFIAANYAIARLSELATQAQANMRKEKIEQPKRQRYYITIRSADESANIINTETYELGSSLALGYYEMLDRDAKEFPQECRKIRKIR